MTRTPASGPLRYACSCIGMLALTECDLRICEMISPNAQCSGEDRRQRNLLATPRCGFETTHASGNGLLDCIEHMGLHPLRKALAPAF